MSFKTIPHSFVFCHTEQGSVKSKSYGLGTGWFSPRYTSRRRWRRFPFRYRAALLPDSGTRLPLSPHCNPPKAPDKDSLGDFHYSQTVSYPLLQAGFQENSDSSPAREFSHQLPYPPYPRKAGYSAHSAWRHAAASAPHCRFITSASYIGRLDHLGSTPMHNNRSPRLQGRVLHAIGERPTAAGV